jgi:hypothetical protein
VIQENEIELAKAARRQQVADAETQKKLLAEKRVCEQIREAIGELERTVKVKGVALAMRNKHPHVVTLEVDGHRPIDAYVYQTGTWFTAKARFWGHHAWHRNFTDALIDAEVK